MFQSQKVIGRGNCHTCKKSVKTEAHIMYKKTNHILHFLLCFPTAGFWIIVWILVILANSFESSNELPRCTECGTIIKKRNQYN